MNFKSKKFIIPIFILGLVFVTCILYFTKSFPSIGNFYSEYEKNMEESIKNITDTNEKITKIQPNKHIDTETANNELPLIINSLSKEYKEIFKMTPSKTHTNAHKALINGVNNNLLLYNQMQLILKNPNAKDLNDSIKNLNMYKKAIIDNYNKVKIKNLTISLPNNSIKVIDNFIYYTEELIKINKQTDLLKNQNKDFIDKMEGILDSFNKIKKGVSNYLSDSKTDSKTYNDVIAKIDETLLSLDDLAIKFGDISVPEKAKDVTKQFNTTLLSYNTYLKNLKSSVKTEKLKSVEDNAVLKNLDKFTNSKNSDLKTFTDYFTKFEYSFNNYKKLL